MEDLLNDLTVCVAYNKTPAYKKSNNARIVRDESLQRLINHGQKLIDLGIAQIEYLEATTKMMELESQFPSEFGKQPNSVA